MNFLEQLIQLDQQASLWLNVHNPSFLDPFWLFISGVRVWFPFYGLVIVYMFWRLGWKKALTLVAAIAITIVLTDQISYHIKEGVMRLRPCHTQWMLDGGIRLPGGVLGSLYGFFSGHASNCFAFAVFTSQAFKKNDPHHSYKVWDWIIFLWATLIALSRIVLGAHFLGDVLVGTVFGLAVGYGMALLSRWIIVKAKL